MAIAESVPETPRDSGTAAAPLLNQWPRYGRVTAGHAKLCGLFREVSHKMAFRVLITSSLKDGVSMDSYRDFGGRASAMVAEKEPDTTLYNWWIGEDGTVISEDGFADEAAFGAHMGNMTESGLLGEWMSLVDVKSVWVLGDVNDAAREGLATLGAVHYGLAFSR